MRHRLTPRPPFFAGRYTFEVCAIFRLRSRSLRTRYRGITIQYVLNVSKLDRVHNGENYHQKNTLHWQYCQVGRDFQFNHDEALFDCQLSYISLLVVLLVLLL